MPTWPRFLCILVFVRLTVYQLNADAACQHALSSTECAKKHQNCLWSGTVNPQCESVLPCAFEEEAGACMGNTWGCEWDGATCRTRRRLNGNVANRCESIANNPDCLKRKHCFWSKLGVCKRRPNIILSTVEDLGWHDTEWNNPRARTPVLKFMRRNAISLDRHYAARMVAPGRTAILTGWFSWRTGLQVDSNLMPVAAIRCAVPTPKELFLPSLLKRLGNYSTHAFGKWTLGMYRDQDLPVNKGFDDFIGFLGPNVENQPGPLQFQGYRCACKVKNGQKQQQSECDNHLVLQKDCYYFRDMVNITSQDKVLRTVTAESFHGENIADHTDVFLSRNVAQKIISRATTAENPFFIHIAWVSPKQVENTPERVKKPVRERTSSSGLENSESLRNACGPDMKEGRVSKLGLVGILDDAHRIVVDALDMVSELDTTIFIFAGTNGGRQPDRYLAPPRSAERLCAVPSGTSFNYPLRGGESTFFEGGIRTHAFIFSGKNLGTRDRRYTGLVSATDWKATLLAAAGLKFSPSHKYDKTDSLNLWDAINGLGNSTNPALTRHAAVIHVWKEKKQSVLLFERNNKLYKAVHGVVTKGQGGGYYTLDAAYLDYIRNGVSRIAIEQPPEMPVSEVDEKILADLAIFEGRDERFMCQETACIFDLTDDPSELNPWAPQYTLLNRYARVLYNNMTADYVEYGQSGLCQQGWYAKAKQDVTDHKAMNAAKKCGMVVPWKASSDGSKPMPCNALF